MRMICRAQTPIPHGDTGRTTTRLPDELVDEQVHRLPLFSTVVSGLWAFGLAIDTLLLPLTVPDGHVNMRGVALELSGIILGALMFWYLRYVGHAARRKLDVGLGYLILNAIWIALLNTWVFPPPVGQQLLHLSWVAVLILIFSMITPVSPRKMLVAALIAASMDPLALWIAHLRGVAVPPVLNSLILVLPNYTCAIVATLPARFLQRIGRRLRQAQELGSYQLIELLGHGGMGEVWRARHRLLARSAAIKLVRPEVLGARNEAESSIILRRFEREAQATAALSSPHTIQVFDFGVTDEGTFYYVMELLVGRDLENLVREFGPVPADRAIYLLRQVCHSLADAHARGLVHRDIKPANIYVCRMGLEYDFAKVLDFGLVKERAGGIGMQSLLTLEQTTTGTPAYMAPEIILGEADVDSRADVYALGCVAYFLLTGQLVFEGDTPMKMLMQHVHATPIPPSQRTELSIPPALDELVMACLAKNPNERPQNAEVLFSMAQECHSCESWNQHTARGWWERHLPELTGPLSIHEPEVVMNGRAMAAS
jgi:tRNA A-37 threonylcarbamoyl transferase component Bud32